MGFFVCLCCFKAGNKASAVTWKSTTVIEEGGDNNDVESLADVSPHEVCSVPKLNLFILQVVLKKKIKKNSVGLWRSLPDHICRLTGPDNRSHKQLIVEKPKKSAIR